MNIINTIKSKLPNCVNEGKIFVYDGNCLKAVSFINGFKHERLKELKDIIKNNGFNYDFMYECYMMIDKESIKNKDKYRNERDEFIHDYLNWKVNSNIEISK